MAWQCKLSSSDFSAPGEVDQNAAALHIGRMWVPRTIEARVRQAVRHHPAVAIVGPRQSGKTSLLKRLFPGARYVSLDDPGTQAIVLEDPNALLASKEPLILDEAQAAPEIFPYLKAAIDQDRRPGRFLMTGSQNLLLSASIGESLAGRAVYVSLLPFDFREIASSGKGAELWLRRASYPEPFLNPAAEESWLSGYLQTYVQRDVRQVAQVSDLRDFSRFLRVLALRNGQMLNMAEIANDVSVAPNTVKRWISVLEASYQVFLLEPFFSNQTKRIIKTPKLYFVEPSLAWKLAGGRPRDQGLVLEATLVAAIHRWAAHTEAWRMFYFRTKEGAEVDLVLEATRKETTRIAAEIKHTRTFTPALLRGLKAFSRLHEPARSVLISNIGRPPPVGHTHFQSPAAFLEWLSEER